MILGGFAYLVAIASTPLSNHPMVYLQMFLPVPLIAYGFGILAYANSIQRGVRNLSLAGIAGYTILNLLATRSIALPFFENYFVIILLYAIALTGFAGILLYPPKFLSVFTLLGEESYALYAIHYALVTIFGLAGILYAVLLALLIEFSLRSKEITKRLLFAYSFEADIKSRMGLRPMLSTRNAMKHVTTPTEEEKTEC